MKIVVASKNPIKVDAVKEIIEIYELFKDAQIESVEVVSGVSDQPKILKETVQGAINRAKAAFRDCEYSFGIESGLMAVPQTKTGKMDVCVCAIYDGKQHHLGLSCAFEFPRKITEMVHKEKIDSNEAAFRCGLTPNRKIGSSEGIIGLLTGGRISRKTYTKQAVQMALIHLENRELY